MSKLYLYAAAALIILGAFAGTYLKGRFDGADNEREKYSASLAAANAAWQKKLNTATTRTAEIEAELATESRQLTGRVRDLEKDLTNALRTEHSRVRVGACGSVSATTSTATEPADSTARDEQAGRDAAAFARDAADFAGRCEQDRITVIACNKYAQVIEDWISQIH